jgi:hypothetical protein
MWRPGAECLQNLIAELQPGKWAEAPKGTSRSGECFNQGTKWPHRWADGLGVGEKRELLGKQEFEQVPESLHTLPDSMKERSLQRILPAQCRSGRKVSFIWWAHVLWTPDGSQSPEEPK